MKRVFNLLAMGLVLFFWFGVLVSLIAPLPGKLNGFLPVCGVIVALLHWLQASMIKAACKRYFAVTKTEFVTVLILCLAWSTFVSACKRSSTPPSAAISRANHKRKGDGGSRPLESCRPVRRTAMLPAIPDVILILWNIPFPIRWRVLSGLSHFILKYSSRIRRGPVHPEERGSVRSAPIPRVSCRIPRCSFIHP